MTTVKNENMTEAEVKALTPEQIYEVYSGKPGCACGCRGNYRVNPIHLAYADKERGYPHEAEDVNYAQVKKVLRIVQEHFKDETQGIHESYPSKLNSQSCSVAGEFASVTIPTGSDNYRVYTVYIKH